MKSCPKCGMSYPDTENYCMECGTRLAAEKPIERIKTVIKHAKPPKDMPVLKRKIEKLEEAMAGPEIPEELNMRINKLESELKRIEKSAKRIDEIKFLPEEEMVSLLSKVNELDQKLGSVSETVSGLGAARPSPGIPEELKARMNELEKRITSIQAPGLKEKISKLEEKIGSIQAPTLKTKISKLESRVTSIHAPALEEKISKLESRVASMRTPTLKTKISKLESRVTSMRTPALEDKVNKLEKRITSIHAPVLEEKISKLEENLKSALNELRRVDKSARRIGRIKFLPKEEAMSLVGEIGEMERMIETMSERIAEMRAVPENIEEIAGYGKNMGILKKNVQKTNSKVKGLTGFIKENEKTLDNIERSLKDIIKKSDLRDFQGSVTSDIDSLKEDIRRKISSNSARVTRLNKKLAEQYKVLADFTKTKERLVLDQGNRLDRTDKKINTSLETMENRVVKAGKKHAEDIKARIDGELEAINESLARREEFENRLSQDIGNLKHDKKAVTILRKRIREQNKSLEKLMDFKKDMTKSMEDLRNALTADQEKSAEDIRAGIERELEAINESLARREEFENRLSQDIGNLKQYKEAIAELRKGIKEQNKSLEKLANLKTDMTKNMEDVRDTLAADQEKGFKSLDRFKEKILLIIGLALQQQAKSRKMRSRLKDIVEKRIAEIREQNDSMIKKTEARITSLETSAAVSSNDLKSRLDEELQSVNEALVNMEKGVSASISSMGRKTVSKSELEDLRKEFDEEGTRIADIRDQLIEQGNVLEEIEGMKENLIAEQKQKMDEIETELRQKLDKVRTEGKKILVDVEDEIRNDFEMKLQSIDKMEKRMEEELDALNKNLAKRKEFESYVNEDIEALKAEIGTLDTKVKDRIAEEKKAMEKEIEEEVRDLGRARKELYERMNLMKKNLNKTIKTAVKKEMADFEELEAERDRMIKIINSMKQSEEDMDMSIEKLRKDALSEKAKNQKLREKTRMELERVRIIGNDSQEKLGMVKDFIDNIEKRFRIEIVSLEERLEKIIKIQEKQELERISPLKLKKRTAKKRGE